jgi:hypothetical protein
LRAFENRVLRGGRKRREAGDDCIIKSFIILTLLQMLGCETKGNEMV